MQQPKLIESITLTDSTVGSLVTELGLLATQYGHDATIELSRNRQGCAATIQVYMETLTDNSEAFTFIIKGA